MQAIQGHFDISSRERPIAELLDEDNEAHDLKTTLQLALTAREFASRELKLPDNDSYKSYADLQRPYVVWSVVATPEFSVKPKQWCFLIVGCLSYRGYFAESDAKELAAELKQQDYDVYITGTTAYSTLGYFDDPLLNTMLRQGEASMIGVMFHELAHQLVHVDGDTAFNEAFASAVEQEGLRRWYRARNETEKYNSYIKRKKNQRVVFDFIRQTRRELAQLYQQDISVEQKLILKKEAFARLRTRYRNWQQKSNYHGFDNWMNRDLNNAHLALIATYQDMVPAFLALLEAVDGRLDIFYEEVTKTGQLDKELREEKLQSYLKL